MKTPLSVKIVAFLAIIAFLLLILQGCVTVYDQTNVYVIEPVVELEIEK